MAENFDDIDKVHENKTLHSWVFAGFVCVFDLRALIILRINVSIIIPIKSKSNVGV